ncbi:hypothetical protein IWQ60_004632 [Tieghemiomyces parasiticus]|uniref:Beige protein homolog 1 n=1 Tax=Tieghemiomyces parasiticus TaxID=78921 RepID=A0A9W8DTR3_9FUNG|nr:hypothetical protein IWQ60_004632 [Tieghemiomyces parasiticus]
MSVPSDTSGNTGPAETFPRALAAVTGLLPTEPMSHVRIEDFVPATQRLAAFVGNLTPAVAGSPTTLESLILAVERTLHTMPPSQGLIRAALAPGLDLVASLLQLLAECLARSPAQRSFYTWLGGQGRIVRSFIPRTIFIGYPVVWDALWGLLIGQLSWREAGTVPRILDEVDPGLLLSLVLQRLQAPSEADSDFGSSLEPHALLSATAVRDQLVVRCNQLLMASEVNIWQISQSNVVTTLLDHIELFCRWDPVTDASRIEHRRDHLASLLTRVLRYSTSVAQLRALFRALGRCLVLPADTPAELLEDVGDDDDPPLLDSRVNYALLQHVLDDTWRGLVDPAAPGPAHPAADSYFAFPEPSAGLTVTDAHTLLRGAPGYTVSLWFYLPTTNGPVSVTPMTLLSFTTRAYTDVETRWLPSRPDVQSTVLTVEYDPLTAGLTVYYRGTDDTTGDGPGLLNGPAVGSGRWHHLVLTHGPDTPVAIKPRRSLGWGFGGFLSGRGEPNPSLSAGDSDGAPAPRRFADNFAVFLNGRRWHHDYRPYPTDTALYRTCTFGAAVREPDGGPVPSKYTRGFVGRLSAVYILAGTHQARTVHALRLLGHRHGTQFRPEQLPEALVGRDTSATTTLEPLSPPQEDNVPADEATQPGLDALRDLFVQADQRPHLLLLIHPGTDARAGELPNLAFRPTQTPLSLDLVSSEPNAWNPSPPSPSSHVATTVGSGPVSSTAMSAAVTLNPMIRLTRPRRNTGSLHIPVTAPRSRSQSDAGVGAVSAPQPRVTTHRVVLIRPIGWRDSLPLAGGPGLWLPLLARLAARLPDLESRLPVSDLPTPCPSDALSSLAASLAHVALPASGRAVAELVWPLRPPGETGLPTAVEPAASGPSFLDLTALLLERAVPAERFLTPAAFHHLFAVAGQIEDTTAPVVPRGPTHRTTKSGSKSLSSFGAIPAAEVHLRTLADLAHWPAPRTLAERAVGLLYRRLVFNLDIWRRASFVTQLGCLETLKTVVLARPATFRRYGLGLSFVLRALAGPYGYRDSAAEPSELHDLRTVLLDAAAGLVLHSDDPVIDVRVLLAHTLAHAPRDPRHVTDLLRRLLHGLLDTTRDALRHDRERPRELILQLRDSNYFAVLCRLIEADEDGLTSVCLDWFTTLAVWSTGPGDSTFVSPVRRRGSPSPFATNSPVSHRSSPVPEGLLVGPIPSATASSSSSSSFFSTLTRSWQADTHPSPRRASPMAHRAEPILAKHASPAISTTLHAAVLPVAWLTDAHRDTLLAVLGTRPTLGPLGGRALLRLARRVSIYDVPSSTASSASSLMNHVARETGSFRLTDMLPVVTLLEALGRPGVDEPLRCEGLYQLMLAFGCVGADGDDQKEGCDAQSNASRGSNDDPLNGSSTDGDGDHYHWAGMEGAADDDDDADEDEDARGAGPIPRTLAVNGRPSITRRTSQDPHSDEVDDYCRLLETAGPWQPALLRLAADVVEPRPPQSALLAFALLEHILHRLLRVSPTGDAGVAAVVVHAWATLPAAACAVPFVRRLLVRLIQRLEHDLFVLGPQSYAVTPQLWRSLPGVVQLTADFAFHHSDYREYLAEHWPRLHQRAAALAAEPPNSHHHAPHRSAASLWSLVGSKSDRSPDTFGLESEGVDFGSFDSEGRRFDEDGDEDADFDGLDDPTLGLPGHPLVFRTPRNPWDDDPRFAHRLARFLVRLGELRPSASGLCRPALRLLVHGVQGAPGAYVGRVTRLLRRLLDRHPAGPNTANPGVPPPATATRPFARRPFGSVRRSLNPIQEQTDADGLPHDLANLGFDTVTVCSQSTCGVAEGLAATVGYLHEAYQFMQDPELSGLPTDGPQVRHLLVLYAHMVHRYSALLLGPSARLALPPISDPAAFTRFVRTPAWSAVYNALCVPRMKAVEQEEAAYFPRKVRGFARSVRDSLAAVCRREDDLARRRRSAREEVEAVIRPLSHVALTDEGHEPGVQAGWVAWQRYARDLAAGPWNIQLPCDPTDYDGRWPFPVALTPPAPHWRVGNLENPSRMHRRLDPNLAFDPHVTAVARRDRHGPKSPVPLTPTPSRRRLTDPCAGSGGQWAALHRSPALSLPGAPDTAFPWPHPSAAAELVHDSFVWGGIAATTDSIHARDPHVFTVACELVMHLHSAPGHLRLSAAHLEFIPDRNTVGDPTASIPLALASDLGRVRSWPVADLVRIHFRRYRLRRSAAELFFRTRQTVLVHFPHPKDRTRFCAKVTTLHPHCVVYTDLRATRAARDLADLTRQWQHRQLSNFDYLAALNTFAGRSRHDLTQYPVFPWVLRDYTSDRLDFDRPRRTFRDLRRPVGALNPARLRDYLERYRGFEDPTGRTPKFHYGTHYSSAAAVAHFLIRREPFTSVHIALQGGKFDHADRQFHSVADAWQSCTHGSGDVKELIPEFYYLPDFLTNEDGWDLGCKQNGTALGDVVLPPWAASPADFIRRHRDALESEYVSNHLHHWVNLIFGYQQTGPAAVAAHNVFYYLTYEDAVDLDTITNPVERSSVESQIHYFGQTPSQLFTIPHVRRHRLPTPWTDRQLITKAAVGIMQPPRDHVARIAGEKNEEDPGHASAIEVSDAESDSTDGTAVPPRISGDGHSGADGFEPVPTLTYAELLQLPHAQRPSPLAALFTPDGPVKRLTLRTSCLGTCALLPDLDPTIHGDGWQQRIYVVDGRGAAKVHRLAFSAEGAGFRLDLDASVRLVPDVAHSPAVPNLPASLRLHPLPIRWERHGRVDGFATPTDLRSRVDLVPGRLTPLLLDGLAIDRALSLRDPTAPAAAAEVGRVAATLDAALMGESEEDTAISAAWPTSGEPDVPLQSVRTHALITSASDHPTCVQSAANGAWLVTGTLRGLVHVYRWTHTVDSRSTLALPPGPPENRTGLFHVTYRPSEWTPSPLAPTAAGVATAGGLVDSRTLTSYPAYLARIAEAEAQLAATITATSHAPLGQATYIYHMAHHDGPITALAVSAEYDLIASGSGHDGTVILTSLLTGTRLHTLDPGAAWLARPEWRKRWTPTLLRISSRGDVIVYARAELDPTATDGTGPLDAALLLYDVNGHLLARRGFTAAPCRAGPRLTHAAACLAVQDFRRRSHDYATCPTDAALYVVPNLVDLVVTRHGEFLITVDTLHKCAVYNLTTPHTLPLVRIYDLPFAPTAVALSLTEQQILVAGAEGQLLVLAVDDSS